MGRGKIRYVWLLKIMQMQSNNRKVMRKKKGQYIPMSHSMRKLNVTTPPLNVKSTNNSMKMKSKAFPAKRRVQNGPTNTSKKAVSKATSGMKGAGRTFGSGTKGVGVKRVDQISPAQHASKNSPTSKTVASNPRSQNKKPVSNGKAASYLKVRKSVRKSMGY